MSKITRTTVKKLSTTSIIGNARPIVQSIKKDGDRIHLYRIAGHAISIQEGISDYGTWKSFKGVFMAKTNTIPGTTVVENTIHSSRLFIPEPVESMVATALMQAQSDNPKATIEILADVYMVRDDSRTIGYTYETELISDPNEADPLQMLMDSAGDMPKLLEAPQQESSTETDTKTQQSAKAKK